MSTAPTTSETGEQIGMAKVLEAARSPADIGLANVVEFSNVSKTYNEGTGQAFTAVRDVNFVVADLPGKGEFISVLGPSGCGKSTILRLIAGLAPQHPATLGDVLVLGKPVAGPGADRGMVFQDYTSLDHRTVLENITFGLECQGVARSERFELGKLWIRRIGLNIDTDSDKFPHELSGGMRQRVAIARTLILKPRIILMDEPFGALDPVTRMNMQDLLIELWREVRATVFFVTHSIEEAVFLGDRSYVMGRAPGTILREMKIEPSDRLAAEMQKEHRFQETVTFLRELITKLEEPKKM
jgi:NitT/TauT family transport system ATP-binding protein